MGSHTSKIVVAIALIMVVIVYSTLNQNATATPTPPIQGYAPYWASSWSDMKLVKVLPISKESALVVLYNMSGGLYNGNFTVAVIGEGFENTLKVPGITGLNNFLGAYTSENAGYAVILFYNPQSGAPYAVKFYYNNQSWSYIDMSTVTGGWDQRYVYSVDIENESMALLQYQPDGANATIKIVSTRNFGLTNSFSINYTIYQPVTLSLCGDTLTVFTSGGGGSPGVMARYTSSGELVARVEVAASGYATIFDNCWKAVVIDNEKGVFIIDLKNGTVYNNTEVKIGSGVKFETYVSPQGDKVLLIVENPGNTTLYLIGLHGELLYENTSQYTLSVTGDPWRPDGDEFYYIKTLTGFMQEEHLVVYNVTGRNTEEVLKANFIGAAAWLNNTDLLVTAKSVYSGPFLVVLRDGVEVYNQSLPYQPLPTEIYIEDGSLILGYTLYDIYTGNYSATVYSLVRATGVVLQQTSTATTILYPTPEVRGRLGNETIIGSSGSMNYTVTLIPGVLATYTEIGGSLYRSYKYGIVALINASAKFNGEAVIEVEPNMPHCSFSSIISEGEAVNSTIHTKQGGGVYIELNPNGGTAYLEGAAVFCQIQPFIGELPDLNRLITININTTYQQTTTGGQQGSTQTSNTGSLNTGTSQEGLTSSPQGSGYQQGTPSGGGKRSGLKTWISIIVVLIIILLIIVYLKAR